nr:heme-binding protein 1-like [Penaeus vannamei]XP_027213371.1 heme-binding protein 1-like [Penaeus vannamei]XP_027213372.1 heme-binding protein 1-like [Penaeus vannamei]XP_027213373.1 heme-binding protein 1-like [Penaeus vannamei]
MSSAMWAGCSTPTRNRRTQSTRGTLATRSELIRPRSGFVRRRNPMTEPRSWSIFSGVSSATSTARTCKSQDPMTVPVTTEFTALREMNSFKMCFFIPEKFQNNPPTPTNAKIAVTLRPEITVFTRTVGGYMTTASDWLSEAASLSELVEADGIKVSLVHMFWVGYDAPLKFWNRRNEVWFPKV